MSIDDIVKSINKISNDYLSKFFGVQQFYLLKVTLHGLQDCEFYFDRTLSIL